MQLRCKTLKHKHFSWCKDRCVQAVALSSALVALVGIFHPADSHDVEGPYMAEPSGPGEPSRESTEDGAAMPLPQGGPRRGFRGRRFEDAEQGLPYASPGTHGQFSPRARSGAGEPGSFGGSRHTPQGGGGMGGRQFFGGPLDLTPLGLSEDQKEKVRQLRMQSSVKSRTLKKTLQAKRSEMRDLMFNPQAPDSQIRSRRKELRQMQDQLEDIILDDFLAVRGILTPEQRRRLPEVKPGGSRGSPDVVPPGGSGPGHHNQGNYGGQRHHFNPQGGFPPYGQPGENTVPERPPENLREPPG